MNYLEKSKQERMKQLIAEIEDNWNAIKTELQNEKAYKIYLLEKMQGINWNINCINLLLEDEDES